MQIKPVATFDYVVFGATGDLTMRKLLPALYHRFRDKQFDTQCRIIGTARSDLDDAAFRDRAAAALDKYVAEADREPEIVKSFLTTLHYARGDSTAPDGLAALSAILTTEPDRVRVFYLATSPALYGPTCQNLQAAGLSGNGARVVLEKPIGHDLASAKAINDTVGEVFDEAHTFRIDHYLGKETVQNLMALRFANVVFERLWNADVIDHVQITVGETVGVEGRGDYYDGSGVLRDMVQNHLLQLLCLMAMEPPASLEADAVRDEKLKVLRALKPIAPHEVGHVTVRGQYASGAVDGKAVPGYLADLGPGRTSRTRDLRRRQSRGPELALGRRPVLPPLRQAPPPEGQRDRRPIPRRPLQHLRPRRRRAQRQQARHPPPAEGRHAPDHDDQGPRTRRPPAPAHRPRHQLRASLRHPLPPTPTSAC